MSHVILGGPSQGPCVFTGCPRLFTAEWCPWCRRIRLPNCSPAVGHESCFQRRPPQGKLLGAYVNRFRGTGLFLSLRQRPQSPLFTFFLKNSFSVKIKRNKEKNSFFSPAEMVPTPSPHIFSFSPHNTLGHLSHQCLLSPTVRGALGHSGDRVGQASSRYNRRVSVL